MSDMPLAAAKRHCQREEPRYEANLPGPVRKTASVALVHTLATLVELHAFACHPFKCAFLGVTIELIQWKMLRADILGYFCAHIL